MVPRWAKVISELPKDASTEKISKVTSDVPNVALDPVGLLTLEKRLEDLASPKDERKMRLILSLVSLNFEVGLCDLTEFLKKYRPNKHSGFDTDLILNADDVQELGVDPQSPDYREYLGLGNFVLINGQAKHYANKPPASKEDLYGNDKGVLTRALSSTPNPADATLNGIAKEIRKSVNFDLYSWDIDAIRERRSFIIKEFVSTIPSSLVP
jgi:hypothetical protein